MMHGKVLPKSNLIAWLNHLNQDYCLIAPQQVNQSYIFAEVDSVDKVVLDYPTTILPPKKVFLPQREELIRFNLADQSVKPVLNDRPLILLGVHPCDMHAIAHLDEVFSSGYPDQHYLTARKNILLVSVECLEPCSDESFCRDMNTQSVPDNYDLHLTDLGDSYTVEIGTENGEDLLLGFSGMVEYDEEHQRQYRRVMSRKWAHFTYRLDADVFELPSIFALSYKSALWEEIGANCLSCGGCNLVCPTCYCFDVIDDIDLQLTQGRRYRVWDSCQLNKFALVAGGHDFRPTRADRLRHRFFHKFKYQSGNPESGGCVGCGRCAQTCLVDISPISVLNNLYQRRALPAGGNGRS